MEKLLKCSVVVCWSNLALHMKMKISEKSAIPTFLDLVKMMPTIRRDWYLKTPLEKWCFLYGIGKFSCDSVDLAVFRDDQTLSLYSYFVLMYTIAYVLLAIHTFIYFTMAGEFSRCLPCTCLLVGPILGVRQTNLIFKVRFINQVHFYRQFRCYLFVYRNVEVCYTV